MMSVHGLMSSVVLKSNRPGAQRHRNLDGGSSRARTVFFIAYPP